MLNTLVLIVLVSKLLLVFGALAYWLQRSRNRAAGTLAQATIVALLGVFLLPVWQIILTATNVTPLGELPTLPPSLYQWFDWDLAWSPVWIAVSAILVVVMFYKLVVAFWQVASAFNFVDASEQPPQETRHLFQHLQRRLGFFNRVDLRTADTQGPFTLGVFQPVIVLPKNHQHWSPATLNRVLVHELEHVRQKDWLWQTVIKVVVAFVWWLPGVSFLQNRFNWLCELNADNAVLRFDGDRPAYADDLLTIALGHQTGIARAENAPLAANCLIERSYCFERIAAVLDGSRINAEAPLSAATLVAAALFFWLPLSLFSVGANGALNNALNSSSDYASMSFVVTALEDERGSEEVIDIEPSWPSTDLEEPVSVSAFVEEVVTTMQSEWSNEAKRQIMNDTAMLANLAVDLSVPTITPSVKVHGFVAVRSVMPEYPRVAQKKLIEGQVIVQFTVLTSGLASDIRVVMASPAGVFDQSVISAIKESRFKPALVNGRAVATLHATQTFTFSLKDPAPPKSTPATVGRIIKTARY